MCILEKYKEFCAEFQSMNHSRSFVLGLEIYEELKSLPSLSNQQLCILYNLAGHFIDIGQEDSNIESTKLGVALLESNKELFIEMSGDGEYFYNLANGKSYLVENSPLEQSFHTIEPLVDIKNFYWRAINSHFTQQRKVPPEYWVNLGNTLKNQLRIIEALDCYKRALLADPKIPQAWVHQSGSLKLLNDISDTFSIAMLKKIKLGYEQVVGSVKITEAWSDHCSQQINLIEKIIRNLIKENELASNNHDDEEETSKEFQNLSAYRQFCITNNLCLSIHSLYCKCVGSISDDLSIITKSGIPGDFIIPMELVLNRLKSEFSLARLMYYEYINNKKTESTLEDSYFSELLNDEIIGIKIEKARTAFRLCFGILDKIGQAICDLFDLHPEKGLIYFENFWQLDFKNRRAEFENFKSPGLLALYSTATDLNNKKNGELAFYKKLRNHLEHQFVVVHKNPIPFDIYESFSHKRRKVLLIHEDEFKFNLEQMLRLTRSSIFYFVFAIQDHARKKSPLTDMYISQKIEPVK